MSSGAERPYPVFETDGNDLLTPCETPGAGMVLTTEYTANDAQSVCDYLNQALDAAHKAGFDEGSDSMVPAVEAAHEAGLEEGRRLEKARHREEVRHWLRVDAACDDWGGWLHDLVEDGYCTLDEIGVFYGLAARDLVDALTRRDDESYDHYLSRVARFRSFGAVTIKIADLKDNLARMDEAHEHNREKYEKALKTLTDNNPEAGE